ncbi:MAG: transglutaminase family protein, partial [Verrucomicrobiota bacterium]
RIFELEIALASLQKGIDDPFLIDRTLRHLLTDLTGNTHRAEICIDKLASPDSARGQLGLVELRGFEMPPHREMALVQSLLVRSLLTMFWEKPFRRSPQRWGTTLHDRFLLPHYVRADLADVCQDLHDAGINFEMSWLEPFVEFRFPRFGTVCHQGIELEIRGALEPWHVLGEEATGQGTSRYVDSSIERLQIKVSGLANNRYWVTCNGRRLPLSSTGVREEHIAAVRFKAWNPPSSLHPSIGADQTLTFDIIDVDNCRSLGGCIYHVSHPGGRGYDTFPVNAREAEARRFSRFWTQGHTPGRVEPVPLGTQVVRSFEEVEGGRAVEMVQDPGTNPEFPHTLDLRLTAAK